MAGWIVFAVVFAGYAWTASPAIGWLDSPELVAASASLGVAHSPGHPAPALLGRLCGFLPLGSLPWRVNLASSLAGAGAAAMLFVVARLALARVAPEGLRGGARDLAAAACALTYAFAFAAWSQSVRAEVYALESLLVLGALAAALSFAAGAGGGRLALAGLLGGLGLANHPFIALTVLLPAAVFVLARRPAPRSVAVCAAAGILGLASLLYLPVRSAQAPEVNWGAPHQAERFVWTVSARAFQKSAGAEHVSSRGEDAAQVALAIGEGATVPLALLALFGLAAGARRRGWRDLAALLAAILFLGAAGRVLLGFDPETPDHHAYLSPALAALILAGTLGLAHLAQGLVRARSLGRRGAGALAGFALLLVVPVQVASTAPAASLFGAYASHEVARWELSLLPSRSLALVSYFQTSFRIAALHAVEAARPDVDVLDRSFLTYPGAAEQARTHHPELAPLIDAPLRAGAPTPLKALRQIASRRTVAVQLHPNLDAAPKPHLLPVGAFARLSPAPPTEQLRRRAEAADARARTLLEPAISGAPPAERLWAELAALFYDAERLRFYCGAGRREAAARALERAWHSFPGDGILTDLARRCRLSPPGRGISLSPE